MLAPALVILASLIAPALSSLITYNLAYDNATASVNRSACGDRLNLTTGAQTFGDIPVFPHIGAADFITHIDHPSCVTCGLLAHVDEEGTTHLINFLAMDRSTSSPFVLGKKGLDDLSGGRAGELGSINATFRPMPMSFCESPITVVVRVDEC